MVMTFDRVKDRSSVATAREAEVRDTTMADVVVGVCGGFLLITSIFLMTKEARSLADAEEQEEVFHD